MRRKERRAEVMPNSGPLPCLRSKCRKERAYGLADGRAAGWLNAPQQRRWEGGEVHHTTAGTGTPSRLRATRS
ncbi:unnamed protein product [Gongylonema pulchrum]|uniref:Uncharacterized protein n=1 Tax=Gongylonema pulchrum TaxID=637853 RepID=A0A183DSW5_9BILA|nr:unnamed protein product [Gongylonema pulchrum]